MSSSNCTYIYQTKNLPFQVYPHRWFFTNDFLIEIQPCAIISVNQKLLIISRVRVGYEMVGGATYLIRYNHLISNKRGWNNCFIKNAHRISRILPDFICKNNQFWAQSFVSVFNKERFSLWPWKMVSVSVSYFFYQLMAKKIKTWNIRFPAKENPNKEKALFDSLILLQYDVKAKYRLISRKFYGMKFFHPSVRWTNQKPRGFESVWQTNQIALFPFVCFFCFVRAFSFQGHTKTALHLLT